MSIQPTETAANLKHPALLRICGRGEIPVAISPADIHAMETVEITDHPLICGSGEPRGSISHCRGVLLTDIIGKADVIAPEHNDTKKMYVIAASDDGYKTVFSWPELFNSPVGEGIMVLIEKDGVALYEAFGGVDLLSTRDILSGPRYVRRLSTVEIAIVT